MALPKKLNKDQQRLWAKAQLHYILNSFDVAPCCATCQHSGAGTDLLGGRYCGQKATIFFFLTYSNHKWNFFLLPSKPRTDVKVGLCDKWFKK